VNVCIAIKSTEDVRSEFVDRMWANEIKTKVFVRLIIYYAVWRYLQYNIIIYACILCSEEKRFIVTAAADPARLHPILYYARIRVTRIGVYITVRCVAVNTTAEMSFPGKIYEEKWNEATIFILLLYANSHIRCIILSYSNMYITAPKTYRVARA